MLGAMLLSPDGYYDSVWFHDTCTFFRIDASFLMGPLISACLDRGAPAVQCDGNQREISTWALGDTKLLIDKIRRARGTAAEPEPW